MKRARSSTQPAEEPACSAQLVSLLLELRAEVAAMRAHIGAQLNAFDQRVARMERGRRNADIRAVGLVRRVLRAPDRRLCLADLSIDLLAIVAAALPQDELLLGLLRRELRAGIAQTRLSRGRFGVRVSGGLAFSSHAKLVSVACRSRLGCARSQQSASSAARGMGRPARGQPVVATWLCCSGARANSCSWGVSTSAAAAWVSNQPTACGAVEDCCSPSEPSARTPCRVQLCRRRDVTLHQAFIPPRTLQEDRGSRSECYLEPATHFNPL